MNTRVLLWGGLGAVGLFGALGAAWIASLPPESVSRAAPRLGEQEVEALLAALKPPKRQRPLIAIIGINDATETTDYLMPYGVLQRADVADVWPLATESGPVKLIRRSRSNRGQRSPSSIGSIQTAPTMSSSQP